MSKNRIYLKWKDSIFKASFGIIRENIKDENEIYSWLHPEEKVHYKTLNNERIKKGYLLGRAAAKKAIAELLPVIPGHKIFIDRGVFGFPVVKGNFNQKIQVCISHCETIALALAFPEDHPLGIDLEKVDAGKTAALRNAMSLSEIKLASEQEMNFVQYGTLLWTVKEALSKILRTGLTLNFKLLELEQLRPKGQVYVSTFKNFPEYKAISYCSGDYYCSLVLPKNTDPDLRAFVGALDEAVKVVG